jgi:hypothetical protein
LGQMVREWRELFLAGVDFYLRTKPL